MPNEITMQATLSFNDGASYIQTFALGPKQANLTNKYASGGVQIIGTSAETVSVVDVATAGVSFFQNIEAVSNTTRWVEIGPTNSNFFIKLLPGEFALARLATTAIYARANTSQTNSVSLRYQVSAE